jgi:hypothetical protein
MLRRAELTQGAVAVLEEVRSEPWPPTLKPVPIPGEPGMYALHLVSEAYDKLVEGVRAGQFASLSAAIISTYLEGPEEYEAK